MNKRYSTDAERLDWIGVQRKAVEILIDGNFNAAIRLVNRYLEGAVPRDLQRQAIAFRGDLREEQGDREAARTDFNHAHGLSEKPDYERYTLEIALGGISEALGDLRAADHWYVRALETASSDPTTSVGLGLLRLLELRRGRGIDEDERRTAEKALRQAWRLLQIEGERSGPPSASFSPLMPSLSREPLARLQDHERDRPRTPSSPGTVPRGPRLRFRGRRVGRRVASGGARRGLSRRGGGRLPGRP